MGMLGMKRTLELIKPDLHSHPRQPLGMHPSWMPSSQSPEYTAILENNIDENQKNQDSTVWTRQLTISELTLIHLARGFIMNPEVIIAHKPLRSFNAAEIKQ